jgi:hypothetical protein
VAMEQGRASEAPADEAATDMFDPQPPRHTPTLPRADHQRGYQTTDFIRQFCGLGSLVPGSRINPVLLHGQFLQLSLSCIANHARLWALW